MSTIWTPGGEIPVPDRDSGRTDAGSSDARRPGAPAADGGFDDDDDDLDVDGVDPQTAEEMQRSFAEARERLLEVPAEVVVANHIMGLYELGALHLTNRPPDLAAAALAIDAVALLVENLEGRLAEEATLVDALAQLRLAYVEVAKVASSQ